MRRPAVASIRADPPRAGFRYPTTALRGLVPARCQLQVDMVCRHAWAYCPPHSGPVPRPRPELTNWRWRWRSSRRCPRRGAGAGEGHGPGLDQPFNPDQLRGGERGLALDCGGVRCRLVGGHGTGSSVGETPGPTGKRNRSEKKRTGVLVRTSFDCRGQDHTTRQHVCLSVRMRLSPAGTRPSVINPLFAADRPTCPGARRVNPTR